MTSMVDIHRAHAQSHKRGLIAYIILIGLLVYVATTKQFDAYITNILMQAVTYSVAVMGLTVVLGLCGQINLAQAAFFGLGAYAVGLGTVDYGISFWGCIVIGIGIVLFFGAFLGTSTLRLGGHYLAW